METLNTDKKGVWLFCVLVGCTPKGRNIEQHDIFFGVAEKLDDLTDNIKKFWYSTILDDLSKAVKEQLSQIDERALKKDLLASLYLRDKTHIDAWTKVEYADGYKVNIQPKSSLVPQSDQKLYFINLGGYKENEFEEYHKKLFVVAATVTEAFGKVKSDDFMKTYSSQALGGAGKAHLDDQHKIDFGADDIICISEAFENDYVLTLEKVELHADNELAVGYVKLDYPD